MKIINKIDRTKCLNSLAIETQFNIT